MKDKIVNFLIKVSVIYSEVKTSIEVLIWKAKQGFPSKAKMKDSPELQKNLADVMMKDMNFTMLEKLIKITTITKAIYDVLYPEVPTTEHVIFHEIVHGTGVGSPLAEYVAKLFTYEDDDKNFLKTLFTAIELSEDFPDGSLIKKLAFYTSDKYENYKSMLDVMERFKVITQYQSLMRSKHEQ